MWVLLEHPLVAEDFRSLPFVVPMHSTITGSTVKTLQSIFCIKGIPEVNISAYRVSVIRVSAVWVANSIKHITTVPFHLQSNGEAEQVQVAGFSLERGVSAAAFIFLPLSHGMDLHQWSCCKVIDIGLIFSFCTLLHGQPSLHRDTLDLSLTIWYFSNAFAGPLLGVRTVNEGIGSSMYLV